MTTADYLTQLVKDVETIRTNLNAQGVTTESTETLTTLAPKINSISQDLSIAIYMRLFDLPAMLYGTIVYESYYDEAHIAAIEELLNQLGGD